MTVNPGYRAQLTACETLLLDRFMRAQSDPENMTFFVYAGHWGNKIVTAPYAGSDARLLPYLEETVSSAPENHRTLLLAFSLRRSFESQWRSPGKFDNLMPFLQKPLVTIPGLPQSPHNRMRLIEGGLNP